MATGGAPAISQTQDNRVHLFRLQILIIDGGGLVLRNILDQILNAKGITLHTCLKNEISAIRQLQSRRIITQSQYDILFPSGGKVPTTSDLDITLIICILRELKCFGLNRKFDWNVTPTVTDVSLEADIWRLKEYRNKISHLSTTTEIQAHDFSSWWANTEQILVRQSPAALNIQQSLNDFKTCSLDPEEEKRVQEEIKRWKDYEADVDQLKEKMGNVKENVGELIENVGDLNINVGKLEANVNDQNKCLDDIKYEIIYLRTNTSSLTENVGDLKANVDKQNKKLDIMDDAIQYLGNMNKEISNLRANVSGLTESLDFVKSRQIAEDKTCKACSNSGMIEEKKYEKCKKHFKDDLIEFYRQRHSKVQLSPLFEENDTPLTSYYIRPEIIEKTPGKKNEMQQITSLAEMFNSGNKDNRELYLTADAGLGKTTFSKYLATSWCHANCPEEKDNTSFEKKDIDCLSKYEFVFLVLLRDSKNLCSIDDLIFELIVSSLAHSKQFDQDFIQEILNREKCLIILDGLDEWTHPENSGKPCHRTPVSIPHRNDRKTCTILTTTRPWKLGGLNLSSNDFGKEVILTKLNRHSAETLITRTVQRLKSLPDEKSSEKEADLLIGEINARNNTELAFVPLLLMYIICLWCDGVEISKSKCELYLNIVELLLSRTVTKHGELQLSGDIYEGGIPDCFTEHDNCTKYFSLLVSLGKLAFYTLSDVKRENTLVFDRKVAGRYLGKQYMTFSLHSGILTESTSRTLTKQNSKVSFSHKTVQEFFAAIYISFQSDPEKTLVEKFNNVQSILDMSMICEFVSKMNSKRMCEISASLMIVINEDEETRIYRTSTRDVNFSVSLYNIQKMLLSCSHEMPQSDNNKLCLQDFFIDGDTIHDEHLQRLSKQNQINMKSLYIDIEYTSSSLREIIALFSLKDLSNLHKLYYDGDGKEADFSLLLFESLQTIQLAKLSYCGESLSEKLKLLKNVKYLNFERLTLSHKILEILYIFISITKTITELTLRWLSCKEHDCHGCKINLDLSKNSQLRNVYLKCINLDESSLLLARDMLNIKRVRLWEIEISAESLQNMMTVLEDIPHCVTVEMCVNSDTEYKSVRNRITENSQTFVVTIEDLMWIGGFEFKTRKPDTE